MNAATIGAWPKLLPSLSSSSPLRPPPQSFSPRRPSAALTSSSSSAAANGSPLPTSGVLRASLRFHASNLPEPILVDPYAGCFVGDPEAAPPEAPDVSAYVLATGFVDGKLLDAMRAQDDLRQVVLLTDGMDTRPYRLRWPRYTLIYHVSPAEVFREASRVLEGCSCFLPSVFHAGILICAPLEILWIVPFSLVLFVFGCKFVRFSITSRRQQKSKRAYVQNYTANASYDNNPSGCACLWYPFQVLLVLQRNCPSPPPPFRSFLSGPPAVPV